MAKFLALLVLAAVVAVAVAAPFGIGGGVVHHNKHISTHHIMSPFLGLGIGHHVSHHSSIGYGHGLGMMGYGMGMMKGFGMYPGGIGLGYGLMG